MPADFVDYLGIGFYFANEIIHIKQRVTSLVRNHYCLVVTCGGNGGD